MITIDLGSSIVTYAVLFLIAANGFSRGFRYMLSIAIFETIGYLLTVQAGDFLTGLVNRFYSNLPKLATFAIGRDPSSADAWGPVIPDNFQSPLLLRVLVFVALLAVGIGYAWPWEGKPLTGFDFNKDRPLRLLGGLAGLYVGVLGISAAATFWRDASQAVDFPPLLAAALSGLPNFLPIIPSIMASFGILLLIIIIIRFDRVWKP
ncbi:MAG: hypothetical protein SH847_21470 [Roseiflexaceae bacterium]|nr:hypothetical protein [Roseiflexaceae bacterium]